jgi:multidrug efflux pump subunit AcrA (membrane-fusion protein)
MLFIHAWEDISMRVKILNALGIVIGIAVGAGLFYYLISTSPAQKKKRPPDLQPTAEVKTVKAQTYDAVIHGYGTVRPSERLDVLSEVPGMIVEVGPNAAEGNLVEKDALLFRIDDSSIVAELEQLTAQTASIDAQITEVKVQQENDIRLLEIEKNVFELAKKDHDRLINIYEKRLVAEQQVQAAETRRDERLLAVEKRRSAIAQADQRLAALKANRRAASAMLKAKRVQLSKTVIRAPYRCRIETVKAAIYQVIQPHTLLARIYPVDSPIEAAIPIEARHITALYDHDKLDRNIPPWDQVKLRADIHWTALGQEQTITGHLSRIGAQLEETTRSLTAIIEMPGPYERKVEKTGRGLLSGTFVKVAIHGRRYENILVVPVKAMNTDNSLYLVKDGKLHNVVVEPIVVLGTDVILPVTPSIPSGSKVVLNEIPGAFEGSPVRVWEKEAGTS